MPAASGSSNRSLRCFSDHFVSRMAGDIGDEEAVVERQLEQQLHEQKESLAAVDGALATDPANSELLAVREELLVAIRDAEDGLLHLKRSRLLKEADTLFWRQGVVSPDQDVEVETLDPTHVEPEPLNPPESYSLGSKCRFIHKNGRWYNGLIVGFEGNESARISFLTPTSENMLMCKFFLQQRCRFGSNCRLSHGFDVPISSLRQYIPTKWQHVSIGSSIWAVSGSHSAIWRKAELESWDEDLALGQVVFVDDGTTAKLGPDSLSLSEYAEMCGEDEDEDSSSENLESSEEENSEDMSDHQGLGFSDAVKPQRGIQTETALFAKWEHHTRGIASKMMASMGYREGMGLGVSGQGIVDPITVKVLPPKQSLDDALTSNGTRKDRVDEHKKRSRGGKRKREKKYAEAVRVAKADEENIPDVFSFINNQLVGKDAVNGSGSKQRKQSDSAGDSMKKVDRRSLVAFDDELKELRKRVEKLEEMVSRNKGKDKAVYEAASRKLNETLKAVADAEAAHASASNALVSKEKEKKWLRF